MGPVMDGGFCTIRSPLPACRGPNAAIPPMQRRREPLARAGRPAVGGFVGRLEVAGFAAGHARWGGMLQTISHAIRLPEYSTKPTNVAIPTMRIQGAPKPRGNCMRN